MADYTEDVDESLSLAADLSESEYSARLCAALSLVDEAEYAKEWNASEGFTVASAVGDTSIGFDAVSSLSVASTASNTVETIELASSSIDVGESTASAPELSLSSGAVVTGAATFSVDTLESSGVSIVGTASDTITGTQSASESVTLEDSVETVIEHSETSGFQVTNTVGVVIELDVVDVAQISSAASGSAFVVAAASADFVVSEATAMQMQLVESVVSTMSVVDKPLIVDVAYPAIWANSERMATTIWKQTPYESFVMHGDELLAAGADGIYAFSATASESAPIVAKVVGDLSDFGSEKKKTFDSVTMAGTASGPLRVRVETEMGSYWYETHLPSAAYPKTHRAPIGRGLTGRYVRFELDNQATGSEGATFAMSDVAARVGDSERVR